jgi:hypothetical protein
MKCTEEALRAERSKLNNLTGNIANGNKTFDINQTLENLDWLLAEFDKRGQFVNEDQGRTRGGLNIDQKIAAEKRDQSDEVIFARVIVARNGLSLLQQAIPALKKISDRCLEIAGKDAVRLACTASRMEGTDYQGKPYAPSAPEFTLPEGYETWGSKIKTAIGI